jgi:nitrile hydratase
LVEELAGRVVDRRDVIGVERVPDAEDVCERAEAREGGVRTGVGEEKAPPGNVQHEDGGTDACEPQPLARVQAARPGTHRWLYTTEYRFDRVASVNGPHDLAGVHGFGPVPYDPADTVFHGAWERRVFGMQRVLNYHGIPPHIDEGRFDVERLGPTTYFAASYFERWLLGAERRVVRRGVLTLEQLEQRREELERTPGTPLPSNPDPDTAERIYARVMRGGGSAKPVDRERLFAVGDEVLTKNVNHAGHTRIARYVRGRHGVIERVYDAYALPEVAAVDGELTPDYLYAVRFDARELWGESAEPNSTIVLDLYEHYLLAA